MSRPVGFVSRKKKWLHRGLRDQSGSYIFFLYLAEFRLASFTLILPGANTNTLKSKLTFPLPVVSTELLMIMVGLPSHDAWSSSPRCEAAANSLGKHRISD